MTKLLLASLAGLVLGYSICLILPHPLGAADQPYRSIAHSLTAIVETIGETDATFRERFVRRLDGSGR